MRVEREFLSFRGARACVGRQGCKATSPGANGGGTAQEFRDAERLKSDSWIRAG